MPVPDIVGNITEQLRKNFERPAAANTYHNTAELLYDLLHKDSWFEEDQELINQLSRRLDITGRLHSRYDENWKKSGESLLHEPWNSLAALLLYRTYLLEREDDASQSILLKRFNTLLKGIELTEQDWIGPGSKLRSNIISDYQEIIESLPSHDFDINVTVPGTARRDRSVLETLPVTVLFYEGPIARAYLETILLAGFRPRKIIQLISSRDVSTGKPVGRYLPSSVRQPYAASIQKSKIHYWPRKIASDSPELYRAITAQVEEHYKFPVKVMDDARALKPLNDYCDDVEPLLITGLKDERLYECLCSNAPSAILFTGGGLVPSPLLEINGIKFIHVHPGYLPKIRGADCVLWSMLLAGHASATSFYMSPGIDEGDIIKPCWLPKVKFDIDISASDLKTMYRAIYSFYDPWVRAFVLRETLLSCNNFLDIPTRSQNEEEGVTFHFMHQKLQKAALLPLLISNS